MKLFKGNPPDSGLRVAGCELNGVRWSLYLRANQSTDRYWSLKLCADDHAPAKANFWIGWDCRDQRITRTRDSLMLTEHMPALALWALETIDATMPADARTYDAAGISALMDLHNDGLL